MDLPTTTDEALAVAAFAEATGPALPGILQQAAIHDSLTDQTRFTSLLETVLPMARALVILAHALEGAEEAIAEREELLQRLKVAIDRKMATEALQEPVTHQYDQLQIEGVRWEGTSGEFYANMGGINHELAQEIAQMARSQQADANRVNPASDAIETTESEANQPQINEIEAPE